MSAAERVENVILGGGAAGKLISWDLARAGRRTVVIERGLIGGSCPNLACMPSKNVIHSAKVAQFLRHAAEFGLRAGPATTDMAGVRRRKRAMVEDMIAIHRTRFAANGLEFVLGEGRFVAPMTIEVRLADGGIRRLEGERVFLDLGTHAMLPDIPGLAAAGPLTHVEALELDRLPAHLVVLGGGYVGIEMAQAFRRFGSEVTVVQHGPQLLAREDPDVAEAIRMLFVEDGIDVALEAEPIAVEGRSGEKIRLRAATHDGERVIEGSDLLVAAGRTPNTARIGLEIAGVALDARGYVKSTSTWRRPRLACGRWASAPAARSSRTSRSTTFGSCAPSWRDRTARPATG
jgi:pyruvate/2-oxoglutarate dehydrogenase complex dihydrolipoamide dehydrogenase (E3) component